MRTGKSAVGKLTERCGQDKMQEIREMGFSIANIAAGRMRPLDTCDSAERE